MSAARPIDCLLRTLSADTLTKEVALMSLSDHTRTVLQVAGNTLAQAAEQTPPHPTRDSHLGEQKESSKKAPASQPPKPAVLSPEQIDRNFLDLLRKQLLGYEISPEACERIFTLEKDYRPQYLVPALFNRYFPEPYSSSTYRQDQKASDLAKGLSLFYLKNEKGESIYKGRFNLQAADKILREVAIRNTSRAKKPYFSKSPILDRCFNPIHLKDCTIRLVEEEEFASGLPLFMGETTKTCQTIGKLGGGIALDTLLSPHLQLVVLTRKVETATGPVEMVLGNSLLYLSEDKKKVVFCSLETVGIRPSIASLLIRRAALEVFNHVRDSGITSVQIGIGGGTLNNLGHSDYIFKIHEGEAVTPFEKVLKQEALPDDLKMLAADIQKKGKLNGVLFTMDHTDMRMFGGLTRSADSRYRMNLVDASNSVSLKAILENDEKPFATASLPRTQQKADKDPYDHTYETRHNGSRRYDPYLIGKCSW